MEEPGMDPFLLLFPLVPIVWLTLQVLALWTMRGGWRIAAWIPVAVIGSAIVVAVLGVLAGSNLAPIWVVFALPLCLIWIVGLWIVRGAAWALSD
jgi:hypothetical protein